MPDISMCQDNECPVRHLCKRHQASGTRPGPVWQAYADFRHTSADGCASKWPVA